MTTFHPKSGDITRKWYVIDATDVVLGHIFPTRDKKYLLNLCLFISTI